MTKKYNHAKYLFQAKAGGAGFTIVELLIVIVVIAILAAISVVGYSGIQTRAKLVQYQTAIRQWEEGIKRYQAQTGVDMNVAYKTYTPTPEYYTSGLCLGKDSDYPANPDKGYSEGSCYGGISSWGVRPIPGFTEHIEETIGSKLPSLDNTIYGRNMRGLVLATDDNSLFYWLPVTTCFGSDTPLTPYDGGTHCKRKL